MIKRIVVAAAAVAVVGGAGSLAVAQAGPSPSGGQAAPSRTAPSGHDWPSGHPHGPGRGPWPRSENLTVVERALTDTTADTGPKGDSLGDVLAFANPIYDSANAKKVGSDNGSCVRTAVGAAYECTWTTTLSGGSLVVTGPFYDTKDSVLAITGGTGKWSGASGQMTLHARDAKGSAYDFRFTIRGGR